MLPQLWWKLKELLGCGRWVTTPPKHPGVYLCRDREGHEHVLALRPTVGHEKRWGAWLAVRRPACGVVLWWSIPIDVYREE